MFRRAGPETLGQYAREGYGLVRDVKPSTLRQYVIVADLFERWAGGPVKLEELDERSVSAWLRDYSEEAAPHTVRGKKAMLLALWRGASDDGACEEPISRRVRKTRVPQQVVTAWTKEEVERLLAACQKLPRWHKCGLRRSVWWDLAVRVAWESGLRWGDQIVLPVGSVRPDGLVSWSQSKTGKVVTFQFSGSTMAALTASLEQCPRQLVMPWPSSQETFLDQVERLVQRAGIRPGTWKWIRRASGTDVELQQPQAGHKHLGNTAKVFDAFYGDQTIIGRTIPAPRELLMEALNKTAG
jgi:integrase